MLSNFNPWDVLLLDTLKIKWGEVLISLFVRDRHILASSSATGVAWGDLNQPNAFSMKFTCHFLVIIKLQLFVPVILKR